MESIIRAHGAIPATIAIVDGVLRAGLEESHLLALADGQRPVRKISRRDLGAVIAQKGLGATTVASTMLIAHWAGIRVFATGGIGGVHRGEANDVSADLIELSQTPVAVVCAGAKAILDLPRTLEWLETFGVPVLGYGTNELPAFYTRTSGLALVDRVDSPREAAAILQAHWGLGLLNGVLITAPIPHEAALDEAAITAQIETALAEAQAKHITGKAITPFLLSRLAELTGGASLQANLALLKNNAQVAAQIAVNLANLSGS
jgi:pseudouridine-5'-phosphate glycosidase